jgi:hypothetical protein
VETKLHPEVMPPETQIKSIEESKPQSRLRFSPKTLVLAFAIAAVSDGVSFFLALTPPLQWAADLVTALLLFAVLGRQWILLPGLFMEAIPGLSIFPIWLLVVGAIAYTGKVQRKG